MADNAQTPDANTGDTQDVQPSGEVGADTEETPNPSPRWGGSTKRVIGVGFAIGGLLLLYIGRNVIALAALAGLIAFLVSPLIRLLHERLHAPRILALFASYLIVFIGVLAVGFLMVDGVVQAVSEINVSEAETSLRSTAEDVLDNVRVIKVAGYRIDLSEAVDPVLDSVKGTDDTSKSSSSSDGENSYSLTSDQVQTLFGGLTSGVKSLGGALLAAFMSGVITVLVALYLNVDSTKFLKGLRRSVPEGYEGDAEELAHRTLRIWRGYLYGQMFNSVTVGLIMWPVLWAIGLPGAFVFALILGVLNMIPTFGPILAAIPAVLAALSLGSDRLDWGNLAFAVLVGVLYIVVVQLHANILAPFITGRAVRLSPATVMLGLLIGVQVGGLVGALLVVPVIATLKLFGGYIWAKLTDRDPFADDPEDEDPVPEEPDPGEGTSGDGASGDGAPADQPTSGSTAMSNTSR